MNEIFICLLLLFVDTFIGLFHRAITQSGATGCPWALQKNVGDYTRILAEDLNCPTFNSRELLDCLRNTEAEKIMDSRKKLTMPVVCRILLLGSY
jgi:carboxylesterase type B